MKTKDEREESFDDLMNEARALLAAQGTMPRWHQLLMLLKRSHCLTDESQGILFGYIESHIQGWAPHLLLPLMEAWKQQPQYEDPQEEQLAETIKAWLWSPGYEGEVRHVPSVPNARIVWIPAGACQLPETTSGYTISRGFWMWQTPVTQEQFFAVMGHNPSYFSDRQEHPVERVTWHEALVFCHVLGGQLGLPSLVQAKGRRLRTRALLPQHLQRSGGQAYLQHTGFRLPTEAEWVYACQAGQEGPIQLSQVAWTKENADRSTRQVATKAANPWKLYDMMGNVAEWCIDSWGELFPPSGGTGAQQDPVWIGASFGEEDSRHVLRGGAWHQSAAQLGLHYRTAGRATDNMAYQGFRPVKIVPPNGQEERATQ